MGLQSEVYGIIILSSVFFKFLDDSDAIDLTMTDTKVDKKSRAVEVMDLSKWKTKTLSNGN